MCFFVAMFYDIFGWITESRDKFDLVNIRGPIRYTVFFNLKWYSNSRDEILLFLSGCFVLASFSGEHVRGLDL